MYKYRAAVSTALLRPFFKLTALHVSPKTGYLASTDFCWSSQLRSATSYKHISVFPWAVITLHYNDIFLISIIKPVSSLISSYSHVHQRSCSTSDEVSFHSLHSCHLITLPFAAGLVLCLLLKTLVSVQPFQIHEQPKPSISSLFMEKKCCSISITIVSIWFP